MKISIPVCLQTCIVRCHCANTIFPQISVGLEKHPPHMGKGWKGVSLLDKKGAGPQIIARFPSGRASLAVHMQSPASQAAA